ncbi:MAG: hypothetical protein ABWZ03_00130 [Solirubrobacterales bacterium]
MLVVLVAAEAGMAAGPWRELHRPLELPRLTAGETCPVSSVGGGVDWESANIFGGRGIGRGPVYAGLGGPPVGTFPVQVYPERPGWLAGKLFWYVEPEYRGRVLIRGRRIDGQGPLQFEVRRATELRVGIGETVRWHGQPRGSRGVPSGVLVKTPGCYAVQVDGTDFSRRIVFRATSSS